MPRAQMTSIFEGQPSKTRPFSNKTRVTWVLGIYIYIIYIYNIYTYKYVWHFCGISEISRCACFDLKKHPSAQHEPCLLLCFFLLNRYSQHHPTTCCSQFTPTWKMPSTSSFHLWKMWVPLLNARRKAQQLDLSSSDSYGAPSRAWHRCGADRARFWKCWCAERLSTSCYVSQLAWFQQKQSVFFKWEK